VGRGVAAVGPDFLEVDPHRLDTEQPRKQGAQKRGADQDIKQLRRADIFQENREQKRRRASADFGERSGKTGSDAANSRGEHLAGQQISLRIGAEIGHEVEKHETRENEKRPRSAVIIDGLSGDKKPDRAADKAENLQAYPAGTVDQKNGEHDAEHQERIDQRRTLGGNQVVGDEVGDVLNVLALMADGRRQNRGRENTDAVGAEVLKEPGNGCEYGGTQIVRVEQSRIAARGMPRPSPPRAGRPE